MPLICSETSSKVRLDVRFVGGGFTVTIAIADELRHYAKADYGNAGGDDNDDDDDVSEAHSAAQQQQQFYEVDALGDDYVDFGAVTGPKGAFTWHATYRLEKERR